MFLTLLPPVLSPSPSHRFRLGLDSKPISIRHSSGWLLERMGMGTKDLQSMFRGKVSLSLLLSLHKEACGLVTTGSHPTTRGAEVLRESKCQELWVRRGRKPASLMVSLGCWLHWAWSWSDWSNKCTYCLSQFEVKTHLICSRNHSTGYL